MASEVNPESQVDTQYPSAIPLKQLLKTHDEYNPICKLTKIGLLDKHDALYQAGQKFREFIKAFLVRRSIECGSGAAQTTSTLTTLPTGYVTQDAGVIDDRRIREIRGQQAGENQYQARLRRAWYTPLVSGMIDFMVAAVNQNQPSLVANDPAKTTTKPGLIDRFLSLVRGIVSQDSNAKTKYWNDLNRNADGRGSDFAAVLRAGLNEVMVHKRAYLSVKFPDIGDTTNLSMADFEARGGKDARICLLTAREVDDWEEDEDGKLTMIRTHRGGKKRNTPFGPKNIIWHCWTFITADAIYEYEAEWPEDNAPNVESFQVPRTDSKPHSLKRMPVVQIRINDGLWVMDRLADTVIALFNRQAAATWTLDQMAFALLVIASGKTIETITAEDIAALKLEAGESANFVSPAPAIFDAQQKDIERLNGELSNALQLMALRVEKDKGGNPASGAAKEIDRGGMVTLLSGYASPLRDAAEEWIEIVQLARQDGISVSLTGLDNFDTQSTDQKVATATAFLALPGIPESARRYVVLDASLAATQNAPAELRENIVQEVMQSPVEPKIPEVNPAQNPAQNKAA